MMDYIGQRLVEIHRALETSSSLDGHVLSDIAALYEETVSTLALRIQVRGEMRFLQNDVNVHKVRALPVVHEESSKECDTPSNGFNKYTLTSYNIYLMYILVKITWFGLVYNRHFARGIQWNSHPSPQFLL